MGAVRISRQAIVERGEASIILATRASQIEMPEVVVADQLLIRLDDTQPRASLDL